MPVEVARRIPVKEVKGNTPTVGEKKKGGDGASMPGLKDVGPLATINLSSLTTNSEVTSGPPSDPDGYCASWAGGCNNVRDLKQGESVSLVKKSKSTEVFGLQVAGLKMDKNIASDAEPPDTVLCSVGTCSMTCR